MYDGLNRSVREIGFTCYWDVKQLCMWHFLKLIVRVFLRLPPLLRRLMVQPIKKKSQINAIYTLSNLLAELSFRTTWQITLHAVRARCVTFDIFAHDCTLATCAYVLETVHGAVRRL